MVYTIGSWTYHITAETGERITVNFGPEYITIDADGETSTVFYLVRAGIVLN